MWCYVVVVVPVLAPATVPDSASAAVAAAAAAAAAAVAVAADAATAAAAAAPTAVAGGNGRGDCVSGNNTCGGGNVDNVNNHRGNATHYSPNNAHDANIDGPAVHTNDHAAERAIDTTSRQTLRSAPFPCASPLSRWARR